MMPGNQYDKPEKLLLLRQYQLEKDRHQLLDMPQLRLTEERFIIKHEVSLYISAKTQANACIGCYMCRECPA